MYKRDGKGEKPTMEMKMRTRKSPRGSGWIYFCTQELVLQAMSQAWIFVEYEVMDDSQSKLEYGRLLLGMT